MVKKKKKQQTINTFYLSYKLHINYYVREMGNSYFDCESTGSAISLVISSIERQILKRYLELNKIQESELNNVFLEVVSLTKL